MPDTKYIDPVSGELVEEHFEDGKLFIRKTYDLEPLLEELKFERGMGNGGWSKGRTWRKTGSIPAVFVEKILREEGINLLQNTPEAQRRIKRFYAENPAFTTSW